MRDWIRRRRTGRHIRRWAAWWRGTGARFDHPRVMELPPGKRILVLSPHPDDDAIGVGGTLYKHHQAGCHVTSIVLTDGAEGDPGRTRKTVVHTREAEARAASAHLGIDRLIFLGEPDGSLSVDEATAALLRRWLWELRPDTVYLPFFLDNHSDHRATTALLAKAVAGTGLCFTCCAFEIWTPLSPNIVVDISNQMERKKCAIGEHRSQLAHIDYQALVRGLASYRAAQSSICGEYAEAFFLAELSVYLELWKRAGMRECGEFRNAGLLNCELAE